MKSHSLDNKNDTAVICHTDLALGPLEAFEMDMEFWIKYYLKKIFKWIEIKNIFKFEPRSLDVTKVSPSSNRKKSGIIQDPS